MQISANGESFIAITEETGIDKIEHYFKLCLEREDHICELSAAVAERRKWNHEHPGQGKDWPVMRTFDRLVRNELTKMAHIVDS